jgi:hypothetical protein
MFQAESSLLSEIRQWVKPVPYGIVAFRAEGFRALPSDAEIESTLYDSHHCTDPTRNYLGPGKYFFQDSLPMALHYLRAKLGRETLGVPKYACVALYRVVLNLKRCIDICQQGDTSGLNRLIAEVGTGDTRIPDQPHIIDAYWFHILGNTFSRMQLPIEAIRCPLYEKAPEANQSHVGSVWPHLQLVVPPAALQYHIPSILGYCLVRQTSEGDVVSISFDNAHWRAVPSQALEGILEEQGFSSIDATSRAERVRQGEVEPRLSNEEEEGQPHA